MTSGSATQRCDQSLPAAPDSRQTKILIAISLVALLGGVFVLWRLDEELHSRHLPGEPSGSMGQLAPGKHLEGGSERATEVLAVWDEWEAIDDPAVSTRALVIFYLVFDITIVAVLGYGLLSWVVWRHETRLKVASPATSRALRHRCLLIGSVVGLVLLALDVIENAMAFWVVESDGDGPADLLRCWGHFKWLTAALALGLLVAAGAFALAGRGRGTSEAEDPTSAVD